ncbi:MAG: ribonuclease activity regulator RraA [SAR202 cluster bacterium]|nr:ribonuclease activity regulator RraA [SAR202 cluster bacterium]
MPNLPPIPDAQLTELREIPTQTIIDALWVKNWPQTYIEGARPLKPGQKMAGRAVTLRFVPHRPDLVEDKPKGEQSAEYVAFELCGPGEVLVVDAMRWGYASIGGDIKFLRLHQRKVGGLVTDASVRDSGTLKGYNFPVFSYSTTAKQGPADFWPWQVNDAIQCGGVLVRPGDGIVGDDDGVVVVPRSMVDTVIQVAKQREDVEHIIKQQLEIEQCSPGKYYPFNERTWKLYEEKTGRKRPG